MAKIPIARPQDITLSKDVQVGENRVVKSQPGFNTGDILSATGQSLSEAGNMIEKAYSLAEKTKAQNILSVKLADIQARANNDPDFSPDTQRKYHEEIDASLREASQGISLQANKDLFLSEAKHDAEIAKIKVNGDILKKAIDQGKANLLVYENDLQNQYINSNSPGERQVAVTKYEQKIDEAVAAGYITTEDAVKAKLNRASKWGEAQVERDISIDPKSTLEELQKGKEGVYIDLPETKRTELIKTAKNEVIKSQKISDALVKDQQAVNYKQAMLNAFDGKLTVKSAQELYRNNFISDTQFSKLNNYLYYNLPTVNEDDLGTYNSIAQMQAEGDKTPEEINSVILDSAAKNKLKNASAKQLIGKTYNDFKNRKDDLVALNAKEMRTVGEEFFRTSLDETDKSKVEQAIYTFHRRVIEENAEGERIPQIAQEIMTDAIRKEYPEINQVETINRVKEMFGVKDNQSQELMPPKNSTSEKSPFTEYPDAFKENGVWKVIRNGQKYRVEE